MMKSLTQDEFELLVASLEAMRANFRRDLGDTVYGHRRVEDVARVLVKVQRERAAPVTVESAPVEPFVTREDRPDLGAMKRKK